MTKEQIGAILKSLRIESGKTQKEVAELLGRKQQIVGHWETGYSQPDANTLFTLCELYGTTVDAAFGFKKKDISITKEDLRFIEMYHALDAHGKEMVDFTLEKEYERATSKVNYYNFEESSHYEVSMVAEPRGSYGVNAAHSRTDMELPEDADTTENDIMDDEDNWK